jgi:hypothetical protein
VQADVPTISVESPVFEGYEFGGDVVSVPSQEVEAEVGVSTEAQCAKPGAIADGFSDSVLGSLKQESENVASEVKGIPSELQSEMQAEFDDRVNEGQNILEDGGEYIVQSVEDQGEDLIGSFEDAVKDGNQNLLQSAQDKAQNLIEDVHDEGVVRLEEQVQKVVQPLDNEGK